MWTHYLLTLYRSLARHRLYAALNVLGLAVGIAVFLVLWLDVRFETGFERWVPNAGQIYVVRTVLDGELAALGSTSSTMGATLDELRADYPQLVGTRDLSEDATVRQGARPTGEQVELTDPEFFKVFDLPLVAGDKSVIFRSPDDLVLTERKSKAYFGSANPMGRRLTITFEGATHVYRVAGVLKDLPADSDLRFDFLAPLTPQITASEGAWRNWGSVAVTTWLRLGSPAAARALASDLGNFVDRHAGRDLPPPPHKQLHLVPQPLLSMHLREPKDAAIVAALGGVGVLTLLLAALNYVNLATARGGLRAREVAVRKVLGATRSTLVAQFMCEAVATALLAALIGLALCELALPLVNTAGGLALKIDYLGADSILLVVLAIALFVGLAAGVYPALVLARFQPAHVLASTRTPGGGRGGAGVRQALVIVQFTIAIAFMVATGVIVSQTRYLRHADVGFRRSGLIVVDSFDSPDVTGPQRASLLEAWRALPGVESVTASSVAPGNDDHTNGDNVKRPGAPGQGSVIEFVTLQPGFFTTYGAHLGAGRFLDRDHGGDDTPPSPPSVKDVAAPGPPLPVQNVVLNFRALKSLGFQDARQSIGKRLYAGGANPGDLNPLTIVGVIDDIRFRTPHEPVPSTIYVMKTSNFRSEVAGVRYAGPDPKPVMARMAAEWRRVIPDVPFRAATIEDNLLHYYRPDDQHGRLFTMGAVLAVAIGCLGLYGLASFTTVRRVREIGIRKTLGASTGDILRLLVGQFLRPVLLANLVAWPLAWLAMRHWLSGFDQPIDLNIGYFLAATLLTLIIALATIAGHALAVARAEPARALRHE